jgi:hypothetical protein
MECASDREERRAPSAGDGISCYLGSAACRNFTHQSWPLAGHSPPPATTRGIEGGGGFLGGLLVLDLIGRAGDDQ